MIASAFEIRDAVGVDPGRRRQRGAVDRPALLMLDSCDHLIDAASAAADELLQRPPGSRFWPPAASPSAWPAEQLWRIAPLGVPEPGAGIDAVRDAKRSDCSRAGPVVQPGFVVSEKNAGAVADICLQLEGLPLAIELAAAQVASLPPSAIAERLRDSTQILKTSSGQGAARHRTLEATVEWSYRLLDAESQRLLRYLSVFANGFTIDAGRCP